MELRDLVELLYTASNRFNTIQATWHYWYEDSMMGIAQERWVAQNPQGNVALLTSKSAKESPGIQVTKIQRRVWWQKPTRWRDEEQMEGQGKSVTILRDGDWWAFSSGIDTLYTNVTPTRQWSRLGIRDVREGRPPDLDDRIQGIPFLDPSFLLLSHDLQPLSDSIYAQREVVQVRAVYRKGKDRIHEAYFWATADAYDLLVDKEYGVLIRYAALLDGQEFAVSSVDQVIFDEAIAEEIFTFPSPS